MIHDGPRGLLRTIVAALDATRIPHMVVGSFASTAYGEPRTTRDHCPKRRMLPTHHLFAHLLFLRGGDAARLGKNSRAFDRLVSKTCVISSELRVRCRCDV